MSRRLKRVLSLLLVAALLMPTSWLGIPVAKAATPEIPVLLYHRIVDEPTNEWTDTSVSKFRSTMKYLHDNGYTTLTAQQYVDIMEGGPAPAKPILLTFDDGTPDFITNALPILDEYEMNAVLFIITGWIDGDHSMSEVQLRELATKPNISLENHTVEHKDGYWSGVTEAEASAELADANAYLKAITGKDPVLLAYPYGHFNDDVKAAAANNGILYAFKAGPNDDDDYAMGRQYIMMDTTLSDIAGWLNGPEPDPDIVIYHELFADGRSAAQQSGNPKLEYVSDLVLDGNPGGGALTVTDRVYDYDGIDFIFDDIGLEHGRTYTVTASVYVAADVSVPSGAEAVILTVNSYGNWASTAYEPGEIVTITREITVDTEKDRALRIQSNKGETVPFSITEVLITAEPEGERIVEVYRETFAGGLGVATPAGGVSLTPESGIVFDGNDDGYAVYVSGRVENWNGIDIPFDKVMMEYGKTYTITITGYVGDEESVPAGAKILLQNVDSYAGLYIQADPVAGEAFTLTGTYTADKSSDRALRIQSNDEGKTVPFYVGDILITTKLAPGEEPPRPPAKPFTTIDFEDQTAGGFVGRSGTETLTVTDEANRTEGGSYALKVEGRSNTWHGPSLNVEQFIDLGHEYKITAWVKLIEPTSSQLQLSTQIGQGGNASYNNIQGKTISVDDGWVQLEGTYRYSSAGGEFVTIYIESTNNSTASFYIDDISFVSTGSGPVDIERDLTPIQEVYQDDFLIGNAVSAKDLEGIRLELLKLHHNLVTAENAMKPGEAYDEDGKFDLQDEDELVQKILDEDLMLHGHVLVWHQQSREALHTDEDGNPLSREEALANLRTHVQTVVEHFGDRVISWDVVNEAMNDNPPNPADWKGSLRQSGWLKAIGSDYIEEAFKAAKEVLKANGWDDIKLYYNDYNDDNQNKAEAIYQMVKEINENYAADNGGELLIDGIGMQGHYNLNTNPANVKLSLEKFISLGVEVGVTELDITAGSEHELSEKQAYEQAYLYAQLFQIYKEHAEHISRITFWGLDDGVSWRAAQSPLVFDRNLKAKPAYYAIIDPDKFIEEYDPVDKDARQTYALRGTPSIDGDIDTVWGQTVEIPIDRYQTAWNGANGVARALWDDDNLYVLIQVSDSQLDKSSENAYEQDSVEVFLDQRNDKATFYQSDDGQYRVNFDNETSFNPPSIAEGFESATVVSGTNYTVEMKIPLTAITPAHNAKLGFDVQVNDGQDGARQSVATWNDLSGQGFQDPSVFGVLTLKTTLDEDDDDDDTPSGGSGRSGGSATQPGTSVVSEDGVVTMKPSIRTQDGRAIASITDSELQRALNQAARQADGKKHIIIELPESASASSYEIELPTQSLQSTGNFVLLLKTPTATIEIPNNMLSSGTELGDRVSIRVTAVSPDDLDATVRAQIGDRPAIQLHVVAGNRIVSWNNPEAPVTVSIPYTPTAAELDNPDHIVVWYIDGEGNITTIPNGRYDAVSGAVVFRTTHFSTFAVSSVYKTFDDLYNAVWAQEAIEVMASRDVIRGTGDNSFSPAAAITRADYVALLVRALELHGTGKSTTMFTDVPATAYYYDELRIAQELGIAQGTGDHAFHPSSTISRQDMMVLTTRALAAAGKPLATGGSLTAYPDAESVSGYARAAAEAMVKSGIVLGKEGRIAPQDTLTRAEAAVILYRIWRLQ